MFKSLKKLKKISMVEQREVFVDFLQNEVFKGLYFSSSNIEPFSHKCMCSNEPVIKYFALEIKDKLEKLGYKIIFFDVSNRFKQDFYDKNKYYYYFFATDEKALNEAIEWYYKEGYDFIEKAEYFTKEAKSA